ncbi:MAG TPA: CBS domain-containing protein [Egibacteraceae bacterium]|jgi:CBS domain-containing protein|nr:CBS domain-containing protein [Egibacteraceae bacterium]
MNIRENMSTVFLTVGPDHTLREAAQLMSQRNIGSALVLDLDGEGPGIFTERDLMRCIAAGKDPDQERVIDHVTAKVIVATGDWSLEEAAQAMIRGGFRHLIVTNDNGDNYGVAGILSMRDIVRCWVQQPAGAPTC